MEEEELDLACELEAALQLAPEVQVAIEQVYFIAWNIYKKKLARMWMATLAQLRKPCVKQGVKLAPLSH